MLLVDVRSRMGTFLLRRVRLRHRRRSLGTEHRWQGLVWKCLLWAIHGSGSIPIGGCVVVNRDWSSRRKRIQSSRGRKVGDLLKTLLEIFAAAGTCLGVSLKTAQVLPPASVRSRPMRSSFSSGSVDFRMLRPLCARLASEQRPDGQTHHHHLHRCFQGCLPFHRGSTMSPRP